MEQLQQYFPAILSMAVVPMVAYVKSKVKIDVPAIWLGLTFALTFGGVWLINTGLKLGLTGDELLAYMTGTQVLSQLWHTAYKTKVKVSGQ